jgi:hypothetical protein
MVLVVLVMATTGAFALNVTITDSQSGTTVSDSQTGKTDSQASAGEKVIDGKTVKGEDFTKITPIKAAFVAGEVSKAFVEKYFTFEPTIVKEVITEYVKEIVYQTIEKIVYQDRIVYVPVDKIVEKVIEKIVYVQKECEEICTKEIQMYRVLVQRPDATVSRALFVQKSDGSFRKFESQPSTGAEWFDMGLYTFQGVGSMQIKSAQYNGDTPDMECTIFKSGNSSAWLWNIEDSSGRDASGNMVLNTSLFDWADGTGTDAVIRIVPETVTTDCD